MSEEKKKAGRPPKTAETEQRFQAIEGTLDKILSLLDKPVESQPKVAEAPPIAPPIRNLEPEKLVKSDDGSVAIPPDWQAYIEKQLGKDVIYKLYYASKSEVAPILELSIPASISNASEAQWEMYKEDKRSKRLNPAEGIDGVKKFVDSIKSNLKLDK